MGSPEGIFSVDGPVVVRRGMVDMQVCVPADLTDDLIVEFAETQNPSGTTTGWQIRRDQESLQGAPERNPCKDRTGYVHVTLDA